MIPEHQLYSIVTDNQKIASILEEIARVMATQDALPYRTQAYVHAAESLRSVSEPVSSILRREGLQGLQTIPGVGETISHVIRDIVLHGRSGMLERLRGESDPIPLLATIPGIGKTTAWDIYEQLGIETLQELEQAAHDGRLATIVGIGPKRLAGIRDSLSQRLGRMRIAQAADSKATKANIAEVLDVDRQYREQAKAGKLKMIAPKRFNPDGEAWLPILHTTRDSRHYTAFFSNSARAHEQGKTNDWVVIYHDSNEGEHQWTVITSTFGPLQGKRIVLGHEAECEQFYEEPGNEDHSTLFGR